MPDDGGEHCPQSIGGALEEDLLLEVGVFGVQVQPVAAESARPLLLRLGGVPAKRGQDAGAVEDAELHYLVDDGRKQRPLAHRGAGMRGEKRVDARRR